ncbi:hypothetical protein [Cellulomonas cellasea]|uniref:Bacterial spore germination immunoglobulin-like domain-containing protein n=2 Tax=Cellulomonas cellasea TaxID=43670 RepID=A0A0A0B4X2_9CELL|nr:hypothetical protein [Cellulomonas cellasea]KGM00854.1 hypothetical protein Q760_05570 [Cellulomonas cellasea DSM 20118]GEA88656.1 hypothetical protein CCE01nite_26050 [Cellulomonas cellasea]
MLLGRRAGALLTGALALALTAGCTGAGRPAEGTPSASTTPEVTSTPTATPTGAPGTGATTEPLPSAAPGDPASPPVAGDGRAVVEVTISFAGWQAEASAVEVSGFVPVVESDGLCRLVLSSAAGEVAVEQAATPDASTTSCGWLSVPAGELSTGTWTAVLSYTSGASVASSTPVPVEVP